MKRWVQLAKQIFIYGFVSTDWTLPNAASDKGSTSPLLGKQLEMLLTDPYSFYEFPRALPQLTLRVLLLKADRKHPGSARACSSSLRLSLAFGKENTQAGWQGFAWLSGQVLQTTAPLRSCSCAAEKRPAIPECMLTHAGGSRVGTGGCLRNIPKQPLSVLRSMSVPQSLQWLESGLKPAPAPSHPHHANTAPGWHHTPHLLSGLPSLRVLPCVSSTASLLCLTTCAFPRKVKKQALCSKQREKLFWHPCSVIFVPWRHCMKWESTDREKQLHLEEKQIDRPFLATSQHTSTAQTTCCLDSHWVS